MAEADGRNRIKMKQSSTNSYCRSLSPGPRSSLLLKAEFDMVPPERRDAGFCFYRPDIVLTHARRIDTLSWLIPPSKQPVHYLGRIQQRSYKRNRIQLPKLISEIFIVKEIQADEDSRRDHWHRSIIIDSKNITGGLKICGIWFDSNIIAQQYMRDLPTVNKTASRWTRSRRAVRGSSWKGGAENRVRIEFF